MDPSRITRIKRVSAALSVVVTVLTAALAALYIVASFLAPGPLYAFSPTPIEWTPTLRAAVFAIGAVPFAVALFAMGTAARLFATFARGDVFEPRTGALLSRIGAAVLVGVALSILAPVAAGTVVANHMGGGAVSLTVGWEDVWAASLALLFIVTGWVLREAAAIAADHKAIV
ncbi:MAG: hypothetical protein AAF318_09230 [Pseudomonadota bacterium]